MAIEKREAKSKNFSKVFLGFIEQNLFENGVSSSSEFQIESLFASTLIRE